MKQYKTFTREEVTREFQEWSGGFTPDECPPEEIDTYIELTANVNWDRDELNEFFNEGAEEVK